MTLLDLCQQSRDVLVVEREGSGAVGTRSRRNQLKLAAEGGAHPQESVEDDTTGPHVGSEAVVGSTLPSASAESQLRLTVRLSTYKLTTITSGAA